MWYFSWVLGVSFAVSFSIINALWLEARGLADTERTVNTDEGL
jgi:cyd operon protein YbgT